VQRGEFLRVKQFGSLRVVLVQIAYFSPRTANLSACCFQYYLIGGVLPEHEILDDFEEPLALNSGFLLILSVLESPTLLVAWVVNELGKDDCTSGRQRPAGPPVMESLRMTAPRNGFLVSRRQIDRI